MLVAQSCNTDTREMDPTALALSLVAEREPHQNEA